MYIIMYDDGKFVINSLFLLILPREIRVDLICSRFINKRSLSLFHRIQHDIDGLMKKHHFLQN